MTERFNVNNAELNKKRFEKAHSHIIGASKQNAKPGTKGAKFTEQEVKLDMSSSSASEHSSQKSNKDSKLLNLNDSASSAASNSPRKNESID